MPRSETRSTVTAMLRGKLTRLTNVYRQTGAYEAGVVLGLKMGCYACALKVLQVVTITPADLDRSFLALAAPLDGAFATAGQLIDAVRFDPHMEMDAAFIEAAFARGDRCYAIWDGPELASYGWYSSRPTDIGDGLYLHFDAAYTYMYKGWTKPSYRGRRLHGIGMARALVDLAGMGSRGLVSYVDRTNTASLRSVYRIGYRDAGHVVTMSLFGSRVLTAGATPELALGVQRAAA